MPNGAPWMDDLAREPAVRRLVRALSLSQRFHFYIVTCKAPVVVDAVLDVVVKETAEARGGVPTIRRIDPYARHDDFTRPMEPVKLVADVMADLLQEKSAGAPAISALDATFASPDEDRAWEQLFARMNERRNAIVKAMPREFLLFLPPQLDDAFKRTAPDFWSIRSGEYEVSALPPVGEAIPTDPPREKSADIDRLEEDERYREAASVALEIGNTALRDREGGVALWAFKTMMGILIGISSGPEWQLSETLELEERAALGMGRALLLMGDVAGAEEAWRRARANRLLSLERQGQRSNMQNPNAHAPFAKHQLRYNVFIAYSREDERYVRELERHLKTLEQHRPLLILHEGNINPGDSWDRAIDERMQRADVVLLMLSADFLASKRAYVEIHRALKMAAERGTRVIPVLLRPVDYRAIDDLARLQPIPRNGTPVSSWSSRDAAWSAVTRDIREALDSLASRRR